MLIHQKDRTFIYGVSKVFHDHRGLVMEQGYQFYKINGQVTVSGPTNPCSISQMVAKHALEIDRILTEWIKKFEQRRDFYLIFESINGLRPFNPKGAFYLYVSCEGFINKK